MSSEISKYHLKIGNLFSAMKTEKELTDKQVIEITGLPKKRLKTFYRGEEELTLSELLVMFPKLKGPLDEVIEEQYVRKFSIKTVSDRPLGFPH